MKREEQTCSFCGKKGCYAKGLCRNCYIRKLKNGTPEYKDRTGPRPYRYSEKTKKILALHDAGLKNCEIVKEVGLTRQAVSLVIKSYRKPTNADRIRAMTDEELAEFISSTDFCELLCNDSPVCIDGQCFARLFNWLKQEVSNAD